MFVLGIDPGLTSDRAVATEMGPGTQTFHRSSTLLVVLAWAAVGIPLAWGVYRTLLSAAKFFH